MTITGLRFGQCMSVQSYAPPPPTWALLHVEGRLGQIPSGHIQGTWRRNTVGNDEKDRELIPEVTMCCTTKRLLTSPVGRFVNYRWATTCMAGGRGGEDAVRSSDLLRA